MDTKLANLKSLFKASINTTDNNNNNNSNTNRKGFLGFRRSDEQWTNSESFGSVEEFDEFVEGKKRKEHGDVVSANGTTWRWCTNCSRMGNHSTSNCKHNGPATKKTKFGNSIPTLKKSCKSNIANLTSHKHSSLVLNSLMTKVWMNTPMTPVPTRMKTLCLVFLVISTSPERIGQTKNITIHIK